MHSSPVSPNLRVSNRSVRLLSTLRMAPVWLTTRTRPEQIYMIFAMVAAGLVLATQTGCVREGAQAQPGAEAFGSGHAVGERI